MRNCFPPSEAFRFLGMWSALDMACDDPNLSVPFEALAMLRTWHYLKPFVMNVGLSVRLQGTQEWVHYIIEGMSGSFCMLFEYESINVNCSRRFLRNQHMGQIWVACAQACDWPAQPIWSGEADHIYHHWTRCWGWGHHRWCLGGL